MQVHYTADAVLLAPNPLRVLVIRRGWGPFKGRWALPGGHVDDGETALVAAVRELAEETRVAVPAAALRPIGVYDAPGRDPRGRYVTAAYGMVQDPPLQPYAADDAADAQWLEVTPAGLVHYDDRTFQLAFDHHQIVQDAIRVLT